MKEAMSVLAEVFLLYVVFSVMFGVFWAWHSSNHKGTAAWVFCRFFSPENTNKFWLNFKFSLSSWLGTYLTLRPFWISLPPNLGNLWPHFTFCSRGGPRSQRTDSPSPRTDRQQRGSASVCCSSQAEWTCSLCSLKERNYISHGNQQVKCSLLCCPFNRVWRRRGSTVSPLSHTPRMFLWTPVHLQAQSRVWYLSSIIRSVSVSSPPLVFFLGLCAYATLPV